MTIFNRVPGIEKLYSGRQQVGSDEFRHAFTVTAEGAAHAEKVLNPELTLAGGGVLVSSFWAKSQEEWDYLIDFIRRLREAIR